MLRSILSRQRVVLLLVVLQLSAILTFNYYSRVEVPFMDNRIALHNVIVSGDASFEYRYRIMAPFAVDIVGRLLPNPSPVVSDDKLKAMPYSRNVFAGLYACSNFLAFAVLFWSMGQLTRKLFGLELALFGLALAAVAIDFTFRDHYFHPWSLWEGALFAVGILLVYEKCYALFSLLSVLSVLNRETSIFGLIGFFFYALPSPLTVSSLTWDRLRGSRLLWLAVANMAAWTIAYFTLHAVIGYKPPIYSAAIAWEGNQQRWPYALTLNALIFGPVWVLILRGLFRSPFVIRRFAAMMPFYWALLVPLGYWWEIRYWISLLPILIPALMVSIAETKQP